ncbi:MAG: response regulator [Verrucomicrobiota bacterium]|nr:response regulator [Verrucomicrobiota bacterium]
MDEPIPPSDATDDCVVSYAASELNNLMHIIAGTSHQIENIWEGREGSEKYFGMLRASIERAEQVTAHLVAQAGGTNGKVLLHPDLRKLASALSAPPPMPYRSTILIADDEEMTLTLLERLLSGHGHHVVCAQSGFECLDIFRRDPAVYDLVLLDFNMPFMNGQETFERLRVINPAIDVVLTTGFIERARLSKMLAAGLSGFLQKPFGPEVLSELIDPMLQRRKARRTNTAEDGIAAAI